MKGKQIDGLLLRSEKEPNGIVLVVLKKESLRTLSIVESLAALQKAVQGNSENWISDIRRFRKVKFENRRSLPGS